MMLMRITVFCLQYTMAKDGSVMGVTHSRSSMLSHCRALTVACNYTEGWRNTVLSTVNKIIDFHTGIGSMLYSLHTIHVASTRSIVAMYLYYYVHVSSLCPCPIAFLRTVSGRQKNTIQCLFEV